jgi:nicotinate-nucleotide--dimethylbenzimidazole phosphoribosyltransferase
MQNTLKPRFSDPQLVIFAADHGIAVEGLPRPGTADPEQVQQAARRPAAAVGVRAAQQLELCRWSTAAWPPTMQAHDRLLMRKIAHGTRNARVGRRCRSTRPRPRCAPAWRSASRCAATC